MGCVCSYCRENTDQPLFVNGKFFCCTACVFDDWKERGLKNE